MNYRRSAPTSGELTALHSIGASAPAFNYEAEFIGKAVALSWVNAHNGWLRLSEFGNALVKAWIDRGGRIDDEPS